MNDTFYVTTVLKKGQIIKLEFYKFIYYTYIYIIILFIILLHYILYIHTYIKSRLFNI